MIMEYIGNKRGRKRSKRKRGCTNNGKKSHNQNNTEVKSKKSRRFITKQYAYCKKDKIKYIMEANTFWENYKAAHEWQKRYHFLIIKLFYCFTHIFILGIIQHGGKRDVLLCNMKIICLKRH